MRTDILNILRCPDDHSELRVASDAFVSQWNAAIREGKVVNRAGKIVEQPLDAGLIRADGAWMYPVVDQIPVLLRDDAISLTQLAE